MQMCLWTFPGIAFVPQPSCWAVLCQGARAAVCPMARGLAGGSGSSWHARVSALCFGCGRERPKTAELCPVRAHTAFRGGNRSETCGKKWESLSLAPVLWALLLPGATHAMCCHTSVPLCSQDGLLVLHGGAVGFASPLPGHCRSQLCSRAWLALKFCQ